ncbi:MAG: phytanoyl-CoA dioxygenase family protein [Pirellulales bacterium]
MLTTDQISHFRKQGFVLVSGIFVDEELDQLEREFDQLVERRIHAQIATDATWPGDWKKDQPADHVILDCHDVQAFSSAWARAIVHPRLTEAMSDCMGSPNIQLHHTKLFQKPAGKGGGFPMHQDAPYFPHAKDTMMAAIVHLTDATEEMGCFQIIPGSHKFGRLPEFNTQAHYLDPKQYPVEAGSPCEASRGDVLFFHYLAIHGSGVNSSNKARKTVLIQVRNPEDLPMDDSHPSHAQGMMLRGMNPRTDNVPDQQHRESS